MAPVELVGRTEFPPIGDCPYGLSLGPHNFIWFSIEDTPQETLQCPIPRSLEHLPVLEEVDDLSSLLHAENWPQLERVLSGHLLQARWFRGKARAIKHVAIVDTLLSPDPHVKALIAVINVTYLEGDPENYLLPLTIAGGERAHRVASDNGWAVLASIQTSLEGEAFLFDAVADREFCGDLLRTISTKRRWKGKVGELAGSFTRALQPLLQSDGISLEPSVMGAEQSNTSVNFGKRLILKLYRRLEEGPSPDLEVAKFLTERGFKHGAPVAGVLEYRVGRKGANQTAALLQAFIPNEGDAWNYTLSVLDTYWETVSRVLRGGGSLVVPEESSLDLTSQAVPDAVSQILGTYRAVGSPAGDKDR